MADWKPTTEAEIRRMVIDEKMTIKAAAAALGVPLHMLSHACGILGIRFSYRGRSPAPRNLSAWVARLLAGDTLKDIATAEGCTQQNVYLTLRRAGLPTTCRAAIKAKNEASKGLRAVA